jgi:hypothetical protein
MDEFWEHRKRFAKKRALDEQKRRALAQFGHGDKPPTPEDPRPTRMTKPVENIVTDAIAKTA